jgi:protocatechuate 3,4-dioxygenase beta subunit
VTEENMGVQRPRQLRWLKPIATMVLFAILLFGATLVVYAGKSTIGDFVWFDSNGNGVQDIGEQGINGVVVELYADANENGLFDPGIDPLLAVTTTATYPGGTSNVDNDGYYDFNVDGGTSQDPAFFLVVITDSNFLPGGPLAGLVYTGLPGEPQPRAVVINQLVEDVNDVDFPYTRAAAIGDLVWYDEDKDGYQDVGEPGIPNVTMGLYDASNTLVATTTTGADGGYIFTGLVPGQYRVDVLDAANPNGPLNGLTHIVANQSLPDPTALITVAAGEFYENADFGYVKTPTPGNAIIGDTVWYDADGDGVQDPGEPGVPGATVTLTSPGQNPIVVVTDQNGNYLVEVPPGTWTVTVTVPPGYTPTTPTSVTVTVGPNEQYLDADFGIDSPNLGTIGNQVWHDVTPDGTFNANDVGIPGVSVDLWRNPDGSAALNGDEYIVATETTNTTGQYQFTGLPAGSYFVLVSDTANVLTDYLPTTIIGGAADNTNKAQPYAITLAAGGSNQTADFGYILNPTQPTRGVIGNQVWYEDDGDGLFEPGNGEIGIPGITMELLNNLGQVIATQVTGPSGDYAFTSLAAGTYSVRVASNPANTAILTGYLPTKIVGGSADNTNKAQGYTVTLPTNDSINMTADFGYTRAAAIGDLVWYDEDKDGYQDVGEPGIPNVTMGLYDASNTLVATTTTGADGGYIFNVLPGTYTVDVLDATNPNGPLNGLTHIVLNQSLSDPTAPITVAAGDFYENADFGYVKTPTPGNAIIGDTVWYDADGDGVQDPGEPGVPGATVTLTSPGQNPIQVVTDQNGNYLVEVPPGTWTVTVTVPPGYTATTPTSVTVTVGPNEQYLDADFGIDSPNLGTIGNQVWHDISPDGTFNANDVGIPGVSVDLWANPDGSGALNGDEYIVATETTNTSGQYQFTGLPAGSYFVLVSDTANVLTDYLPTTIIGGAADNTNKAQPYRVTLPLGGNNQTADFGYILNPNEPTRGVIGNQVWYEDDGDGLFEPGNGEIGIPGITMELLNNLGQVIATQVTGPSGDYAFTSLAAGTYSVRVASNPANTAILTGYLPTKIVGGSADNTNKAQGYTVTLPTNDSINMTADFGYTRAAAIGDLVWYDEDKDGYQDVGEPGIPNVTMGLYDASNTLVATTTTGADGGYIFNVLPGTYTVDVLDATNPNGPLNGLTHIVLNQSLSDPTAPITVAAGEFYENADFGYVKTPTPGNAIIGDTVWYDADGDGVQDPGEPGVPGATVTLTSPGQNPIVVVTDQNGNYLVEVPPGTWTVTVTVPPGFTPTTPTSIVVTVVANEQYLDADFGIDSPNLGTIGNQVWHDVTPDGTFNANDVGIPGVSVDLWRNPDGSAALNGDEYIVATETTTSTGQYLFTGLPAGSYFVLVSDTANVLKDYLPTTIIGGAADNTNKAQPYAITLAAGATNLTADFGYILNPNEPNRGVIGNQVWYEKDGDGLYEPGNGDIGIEGVTVELLNSLGQVIATQVTGPSGDYAFTSLSAGTYQVRVANNAANTAILSGYQPTTIIGGSADHTNKAQPYTVTLPTNDSINMTADFGYKDLPLPAAIGDLVWYDEDKDGYQDVGEPGIPNVTMGLYDVNGTLVATTTTGADGGYIFTGLVPGQYRVDVLDAANPNGPLNGLTHIVANQSLPDPTALITVAPGEFYENADFGYVKTPTPGNAIIGDTVWYDADGDGVQDPGEPGVPGATVTLTSPGQNPIVVVTDQNGNYLVEVPPGTWTVTVTVPPGYTATTPTSVTVTVGPNEQYLDADFGIDSNVLLGSIGNQVWHDVSPDGTFNANDVGIPGVSVDLWRNPDGSAALNGDEYIVATETTNTSGQYQFTGLPAGSYFVLVSDTANVLTDYLPTTIIGGAADNTNKAQPYAITLAAGGSNQTADFGYILNPNEPTRGVIGNQVWYEDDGDGLFEPGNGEIGIPGITMELLNNLGQVIATQVTGPSGDYAFTGLAAGTYSVRVASNPANTAILTGYLPTKIVGGSADNTNKAQGYTVTLPTNDSINMTADFGYTRAAAIGDLVWYDEDKDGYQDVGEPGIPNVTMGLYDASNTLVATTTTGADGGYIFNVLPGTYTVDVLDATNPNGALNGLTHIVLNQSLPDPTAPITVAAGDFYENADFGYVKTPTPGNAIIGDTVWYDADGDGVQDPGEPGVPGATVTLTSPGQNPIVVVTDQNGNYLVEVPPGTWTVTVTVPPGFTPTTPTSIVVTVVANEQYLDADFGIDSNVLLGSIGNQVWHDKSPDGTFNANDVGIPGVSVDLWANPDGSAALNGDEYIVATETTNTSGQYLFTGLPAGSYFVRVSDTANVLTDYLPTTIIGGVADNTNKAQPYAITLAAGATNLTADFGYILNPNEPNRGVIGNQVWYETGSSVNGLFEPGNGDIGIEGVTVELLNSLGQVIATQVTGPSGDYAFTSLSAGTYQVRIGSSITYPNNGAILGAYQGTVLGPNPGQDNNNQAQPYTVVLPTDGVNMTADFGYTDIARIPAAIGDLVWYDANGDGIQDVGEPGIPNVTMGLFNLNGTLIATTTTGADGGYIFPNLQPGTYTVDVLDAANPNGTLNGLTHVLGLQSQPDPTGPITVAAGQFYEQADFGYWRPPAGNAVIGDTVWYDSDGNGKQDPGEPGAPGVTVTLTSPGQNPIVVVTDQNGHYLVTVPPGTWTISVTVPPGYTATTPTSLTVTVAPNEQYLDADFGIDSPNLGSIGNLVWFDSVQDGIFDSATEIGAVGVSVDLWRNPDGSATLNGDESIIGTTTTDSNGRYLFQGLTAGAYFVKVSDTANVLTDYEPSPVVFPGVIGDDHNRPQPYLVNLTAGQNFTQADFGYVKSPGTGQGDPKGVIGNQVWFEADADGLYEPSQGETGISGLLVELLDSNGQVIATRQTGPSGDYAFTNLFTGTYQVRIANNATNNAILADYLPTTIVGGTADNTNKAQPYTVVLPTMESINMTADFGYTNKSVIGDFVWFDVNKNGVQDAGEPGIPGVTMQLLNSNGQVIATDVTDANGLYEFPGLLPGSYTVRIDPTEFQPGGTLQGWTVSPQGQGGNPATDSNGNANGEAPVTLTLGQLNETIDFGFNRNPDWAISKRLNTPEPVRLGNLISFTIRITNTGDVPITGIPLQDTYNAAFLQFFSASAPGSSVQTGLPAPYANTGVVSWANVLSGPLAPGSSVSLVVTFTGIKDTDNPNSQNPEDPVTVNRAGANSIVVDPDGTGPIPPVTVPIVREGRDDVIILNPTSVVIADSSLTNVGANVQLAWTTATESDVLGFSIVRVVNGVTQDVTKEMIVAARSGQSSGSSYQYQDVEEKQPGVYYYQLEITCLMEAYKSMGSGW